MSEVEIILTHILKCRSIDLVLDKPVLSIAQQAQFDDYKKRRAAGEPLQYILGTCNFMGLELTVNSTVLVPRPETEQLVDAALKQLALSSPNALVGDLVRILDLGTGSGNIAIALAKFVPQSHIVSIDKSVQALEVAICNAKVHGVDDRIKFIHQDLNEFLKSVTPECFSRGSRFPTKAFGNDNKFDLIISNPPYVPTSQLSSLPQDVKQEPLSALDGGVDGLDFYRIIIKYTPYLLRMGACLMMEFGDGQAVAIKTLVQDQKAFSNIEIIQDLAGRDRIILAVKI